MKSIKCQSISKTSQKQCENNALKGCAYCWIHYPKKESIEFFVAGIILTFLFQVIFDFVTVSPEEKKMMALQNQIDVLENQNQELINGKNELLRSNNQLKESIDKYQIENNKLKDQVELLSARTKNIDTLSKDETRIGDLILQRKGSTLNIDTVDNVVLARINDAKNAAKNGDIDKAISIIEETERLHPQNISDGIKILKATYLCKRNDYPHALRVLKDIGDKNISTENAQVYFNLIGYCYGVLKDYESAAKYLELAVEKNTNSRITNEAKSNLVIIEEKLGKQ